MEFCFPQTWSGRSILEAVAFGIMRVMEMIIRLLVGIDGPRIFSGSLAWDETTERLKMTVPELGPLHASQQMSAWHVLVSHGFYQMAWSDDINKTYLLDGLRPPAPLLSTEAAAIYDGLYNQPAAKNTTSWMHGPSLARPFAP